MNSDGAETEAEDPDEDPDNDAATPWAVRGPALAGGPLAAMAITWRTVATRDVTRGAGTEGAVVVADVAGAAVAMRRLPVVVAWGNRVTGRLQIGCIRLQAGCRPVAEPFL